MTLYERACAVSNAIARSCSTLAAQIIALVVCTAAWVIWPPVDPFNSFVSDAAFFLMFVLLRSGERDTEAMQKKLDAIIAGTDADDTVAGIERTQT